MKGLRTQRAIWTVVFLGTTLAAIVMECVAGLWHPTGWTIPWTEYLARYVPWPIQLIAYVALAVWLPFHFWRHDHLRKDAYRQGLTIGRGEGHAQGYALGATAALAATRGDTATAGCTCLAPAVHGHHCGR
jgi:hypothetical protein